MHWEQSESFYDLSCEKIRGVLEPRNRLSSVIKRQIAHAIVSARDTKLYDLPLTSAIIAHNHS